MSGSITAAVIGGTAVLGGAYIASQGAQNAANTQANAATAQQQNLLAAGNVASQNFVPYATYGATPLASLTANNPYFNTQFSNADLNAQLAPNYAFMLNQGQQANMMANNATGGVGGNTLKSLQDYTQNYAANAYQNAFNNFQTQRGNISAIDLANANLGLAGTTGQSNAQLGTATNVANLGIGAANATAASQIAQGNIYGGAANTLGSLGYGYFNSLNNQNMSGSNVNSLGSQNYVAPEIGGAPSGGYTNMGGSGYGIGGFAPVNPA